MIAFAADIPFEPAEVSCFFSLPKVYQAKQDTLGLGETESLEALQGTHHQTHLAGGCGFQFQSNKIVPWFHVHLHNAPMISFLRHLRDTVLAAELSKQALAAAI